MSAPRLIGEALLPRPGEKRSERMRTATEAELSQDAVGAVRGRLSELDGMPRRVTQVPGQTYVDR